MKNILIYIAGIITGFILLIAISLCITKSSNNEIMLFSEPGECLRERSFEVFQVLDSGDALAKEKKTAYDIDGLIVLFLCNNETYYYDDQKITIPTGKCVRQIGIYKYPTKSGFDKTVPVVSVFDK